VRKLVSVLLASLSALVLAAAPVRAALIISELCDPKFGYDTDRFIEIYNSGPATVDLTGWSVAAVANGSISCTWPLSGMLPAGEARVCGNTTNHVGMTVTFQNSAWNIFISGAGSYNWNGKSGDGARLLAPGNVVVDEVVSPGIDLFVDSPARTTAPRRLPAGRSSRTSSSSRRPPRPVTRSACRPPWSTRAARSRP
jgi:hypothetical protein